MTDWQNTLDSLRTQFLQGTGARLDRIRADLGDLRAEPGNAPALADLRLAFHGFSGLGGSFGFPRVTLLGMDGERRCDALVASGRPPGETELADFELLLEGLRSALEPSSVSEARPDALPIPASEALVVEADPLLRASLAGAVERAGMSLRTVSTRAEALAALEIRMPEAVLVDAVLPDGSGYALVERIRAIPGGEGAAVLLVASSADVFDRIEAIHCGADGLFEKPIDAEAIERRLQQLLVRGQAEAPRVLSVEDDPDQAQFLRSVLESAGYEVAVATTAAEFEETLTAFRPDLVLMDILLPGGISGYDLARYLRQDERYATLPVLFLTTEQQITVRIEALKAGGDDHLAKPIVPGLLLSTVAARIQRARFLTDLLERDGLTRLLSHTPFLERVRAAHVRRLRSPKSPRAALVMIDLDHFKKVNDTWGHPVGDRVLTALAGLLRSQLRQSDAIGRLGGEEFGALLEDLTIEDAVRLVERLLADFGRIEHRTPTGETFHASFSAGIAMSGMASWTRWLEAADAALYRAKGAGRSRVVAAETEETEEAEQPEAEVPILVRS